MLSSCELMVCPDCSPDQRNLAFPLLLLLWSGFQARDFLFCPSMLLLSLQWAHDLQVSFFVTSFPFSVGGVFFFQFFFLFLEVLSS
jgi:hypothetical protein